MLLTWLAAMTGEVFVKAQTARSPQATVLICLQGDKFSLGSAPSLVAVSAATMAWQIKLH